MTGSWDQLAATGTDPELLHRAIAWHVRIGPARLHGRLATLAEDRPDADPAELVARLLSPPGAAALAASDRLRDAWGRAGVRVALAGAPSYPSRLAAGWPATGGPLWLAIRGRDADALFGPPAVAIVGSRRATPYGTGVAAWLAASAAAAGVTVVSGGARGIDAAAHRSALGGTIVVLGCGHDVAYPRPHAQPGGLFDEVVAAGGAIVSASLPGEQPRPFRVRARNRVVAGLADAVVVVEGREHSGTLRTASDAAELGRSVLAVPGDVRAPGSAAPHLLLSEGAAPCTGPGDLLRALGGDLVCTEERPVDGGASVLPAPVLAVLTARWPRPIDLDELAAAAGLPAARLLGALTRARVAGEVVDDPVGIRLRRVPTSHRKNAT